MSSSSIAAVGYDEASARLEIAFHRGTVYRYSGVPAAEVRALLEAESIGAHFNRRIRSRYPYERLDQPYDA